MSDTCKYVKDGTLCPHLATHYVVCSPYAPHVWEVYGELIEYHPGAPEHSAEFCLRHAGDVAQMRQTHLRRAVA